MGARHPNTGAGIEQLRQNIRTVPDRQPFGQGCLHFGVARQNGTRINNLRLALDMGFSMADETLHPQIGQALRTGIS